MVQLQQPSHEYDVREGLNPRRVTNAMWDYSWLHGHHPGGPFEDWDRCLDELVQRGFNTVRIDAFPHITGAEKPENRSRTIPAAPLLNWGFSTRDCHHDYPASLIEFVQKCRSRNIWVILSTWSAKEIPLQMEANGEERFHPLWLAWERTLDLLAAHQLLGSILYVDFDQEFPFFSALQPVLNELDNTQSTVEGDAMEQAGRRSARGDILAWNTKQMDLVADYFTSTCRHFQSRYPGLRFTFSLTSFWREVRALQLRVFDVLELHIWIHSPRFDARTGFPSLIKNRGEHDYRDYMRRLNESFAAMRPMYMAAMHNQMREAANWAHEMAAPLITTESWGPWWHMDSRDMDWQWLREWCEECMALAPKYGFWGVTPWNYSHPYWQNWNDTTWYQKVNRGFLESP